MQFHIKVIDDEGEPILETSIDQDQVPELILKALRSFGYNPDEEPEEELPF